MTAENIKGELSMGLKLVAFKPVSAELAPLALMGVDAALAEEHFDAVSEIAKDEATGEYPRCYYGSAQKTYVKAICSAAENACTLDGADGAEALERLSFPELKKLGNMIDKKSVAFNRIYSEKELASAATEEERRALNERNEKMIRKAEVALRKR